jgi:hypothetical protein
MIPLILAVGAVAYVFEKLQDQRTAAEKQLEADVLEITSAIAIKAAVIGLIVFSAIPLKYSLLQTFINMGILLFDIIVKIPLLIFWVVLI